jgi:hypothetical protein
MQFPSHSPIDMMRRHINKITLPQCAHHGSLTQPKFPPFPLALRRYTFPRDIKLNINLGIIVIVVLSVSCMFTFALVASATPREHADDYLLSRLRLGLDNGL